MAMLNRKYSPTTAQSVKVSCMDFALQRWYLTIAVWWGAPSQSLGHLRQHAWAIRIQAFDLGQVRGQQLRRQGVGNRREQIGGQTVPAKHRIGQQDDVIALARRLAVSFVGD